MTFSHWFEQLCAGELPYIFDLSYYWKYHSNLVNSLLIDQPIVAATTLIIDEYFFINGNCMIKVFPYPKKLFFFAKFLMCSLANASDEEPAFTKPSKP